MSFFKKLFQVFGDVASDVTEIAQDIASDVKDALSESRDILDETLNGRPQIVITGVTDHEEEPLVKGEALEILRSWGINWSTSEEWIRENAYYRWEAAGRPEGRDVEFWAEAEREFNEMYLGPTFCLDDSAYDASWDDEFIED